MLGKETDTQDLTGNVLAEKPVTAEKDEVERAIRSFEGAYDQIPPMYSALKVQGQKLCDLARKGIEVERKPRRVYIYKVEILQVDIPRVVMRVYCSKGTYIRTLCHDIGKKLGCGGCMASLKRTEVAAFLEKDALTLAQIQEKKEAGALEEILYPVDFVFSALEKGTVKKKFEKLLYNGNRIHPRFFVKPPSEDEKRNIRVYDEADRFIGIYQYDKKQGDYKPVKIFLEQ